MRWIFHTLVFVFFFSLLAILLSDFVFRPITSSDGRLVHPPTNEHTLSLNNARLNLPQKSGWRSVELDFRLEPGEVLHFIINKVRDNYVVLRLSRSPDFDHALLAYNDGIVSEKKPLPNLTVSDASRLRFEKDDDGIQIVLDGENIAYPPLPRMNGFFEFAMTPAGSIRLFDRLRLRQVILSNHRQAPRSYWRAVVYSLPFLALIAAIAAGLFVLLLRSPARRQRWLGENSCPLLMFLFTLDCLLLFAVFYFHKAFYDFLSPVFHSRFLIRFLVVAFVSVSLLLARLLPSLLRSQRRRRWTKHPLFFPLMFAVLTPLGIYLSIVTFFSIAQQKPLVVEPPPDASTPRILCYGGSSTAGFPYEKSWPHAYPMMLQNVLRAQSEARMEVINLGVCARNMGYIVERLESDLTSYRPGYVIFDSVANNILSSKKKFTERYLRAIDLCRQHNAQPVLVLEPSFVTVYTLPDEWKKDQRRREKMLVFYDELRRIAAEQNALLIDPTSIFYQYRERFLFIDSRMHLTKYGHTLLALILADALYPPPQ